MRMNVSNPVFEAQMMGNWLQKAGYRTGQFGKLLNPIGMVPYCQQNNSRKIPGFDDYLTMCDVGCPRHVTLVSLEFSFLHRIFVIFSTLLLTMENCIRADHLPTII